MKWSFYLLILLFLGIACTEKDSFSTDISLHLDFQGDTLLMDTVFSQTPSSTYSFWVYNRNNKGLRLQSIRLRRGNQTGFRVNADGIYLDNANGSQVSGIEVRPNDSILVFVELTAAKNGQQEPVSVEDDLLFSLESGMEQKICLKAWAWDTQKLHSPVISENQVIESVTPIIIYGDLKIAEGATLTIRNTTLYFHDNAGIEVYGTLHVENSIMRGDRLDRMFSYLPYDRICGQWKGIHIYESSMDNKLMHTEIRNPHNGIVCDSAGLNDTDYRLMMKDCVIHNCLGMGLRTVNSHIRMENCQLTNAQGDCLNILGGVVDILQCTFAQFYPFSANHGAAIRFSNRQGDVDYPLLQMRCENSILTGYQDDVLFGEQGSETVPFSYFFQNCLIRTPVTANNSTHFAQIKWETPNDSVQGKQHFVKVDEENLYYDFRLNSSSPAQGLGCYY